MTMDAKAKQFIEDQWTEGDSAGVIQVKLGKELKVCVTRNTILGHIDRAKKAGRIQGRSGGNVLPFRKPINSLHPPARPKYAPRLRLPLPEPIGPLNDFPMPPDPLHGACQYTEDHPATGDWRMCGHATKNSATRFCEAHAAVCFGKQQTGENANGQAAENAPQGGELSGSQAQPSAA